MYKIARIQLAVKLKSAGMIISKGYGITTFPQIWVPVFPTTLHLFSSFTPVYYISTIWYLSAYTSNAETKEKKVKKAKT